MLKIKRQRILWSTMINVNIIHITKQKRTYLFMLFINDNKTVTISLSFCRVAPVRSSMDKINDWHIEWINVTSNERKKYFPKEFMRSSTFWNIWIKRSCIIMFGRGIKDQWLFPAKIFQKETLSFLLAIFTNQKKKKYI